MSCCSRQNRGRLNQVVYPALAMSAPPFHIFPFVIRIKPVVFCVLQFEHTTKEKATESVSQQSVAWLVIIAVW